MPLLEVSDFRVSLEEPSKTTDLVRDVALAVERGKTLCIVGESGSGKTVTALSILRLLEFTSSVEVFGRADFDGQDLVALDQLQMAAVRGRRASVIFQECMEALNPTKRIGPQLVEAARDLSEDAALEKAAKLLAQVGIPDPAGCLERYPHQLSGGMQQRTMIAMALMCDPELLIADEPTTALDVTIQAEILTLLVKLQRERNMAIVLITHDMGIAAEIADRVAVMYAGRLVEEGPCEEILSRPKHPYTKALLECVPRPDHGGGRELRTIPGSVPSPSDEIAGCRFMARCGLATEKCAVNEPTLVEVSTDVRPDGATIASPIGSHLVSCWNFLTYDARRNSIYRPERDAAPPSSQDAPLGRQDFLVVDDVSKVYSTSARSESIGSKKAGNSIRAVDQVSVELRSGEFFCLVGESGSGKTTLGRLIARLEPASDGSIILDGSEVTHLRGRAADREFRRDVQIIFQDPNGSLDPRQTIGQAIAEPLKSLLKLKKPAINERVNQLLDEVNLPRAYAQKRPSELSGGQRQRVAIARAVATSPKLIVADEPTSALDVSVQGQIVNLLRRLQDEHGLTYLFITHNLSLVLSVAHRVGVMYLGALVEIASAEALSSGPAHPYTQMLLNANPDPYNPRSRDDRAKSTIGGLDAETGAVDRTVGCRFRDRCPRRQDLCDREAPSLTPIVSGQLAACHFPLKPVQQ
ncbi:ABC transporter ATP-binding protein [Antricoccus suffuscus]|uniref:dipeptide ABC transporter ATP-binding protein n=1 Tax=Antricoccus suffuscus TaxID=1629062 RepID=UPI0014751041|nr:ABC transporter ATP-binding protein [Antricoccus suffuscus]